MARWGRAGHGSRPRLRKRTREAAREARRGDGDGGGGWGGGEGELEGGRSDPATVGARWGDSRTSRLGGQQQPDSGPGSGRLGSRLRRASRRAQPLTAAVARLCMLGAAAALLLPPDAPDPRPGFSGGCAARDEEPPSASGWLLPLR